jgi:hypothetical protein
LGFVRAEVVVRGEVRDDDLWPYGLAAKRDGTTTQLTMTLHDSRELVLVLRQLVAARLEVISVSLLGRQGCTEAAVEHQAEARNPQPHG